MPNDNLLAAQPRLPLQRAGVGQPDKQKNAPGALIAAQAPHDTALLLAAPLEGRSSTPECDDAWCVHQRRQGRSLPSRILLPSLRAAWPPPPTSRVKARPAPYV